MKKIFKFFTENWEVILMLIVVLGLGMAFFYLINTWYLGTIFNDVAK